VEIVKKLPHDSREDWHPAVDAIIGITSETVRDWNEQLVQSGIVQRGPKQERPRDVENLYMRVPAVAGAYAFLMGAGMMSDNSAWSAAAASLAAAAIFYWLLPQRAKIYLKDKATRVVAKWKAGDKVPLSKSARSPIFKSGWNRVARLLNKDPNGTPWITLGLLLIEPVLEQVVFKLLVGYVPYFKYNPFLSNDQPIPGIASALGGILFGFILHGDRFFERDADTGKLQMDWRHFHFWAGLFNALPLAIFGALSLGRWAVAGSWGVVAWTSLRLFYNLRQEEGVDFFTDIGPRLRNKLSSVLVPLGDAISRRPWAWVVGIFSAASLILAVAWQPLWMSWPLLTAVLSALVAASVITYELLGNSVVKEMEGMPGRILRNVASLTFYVWLAGAFMIYTQQGWRMPWTRATLSPAAQQAYDRYHIVIRGASDKEAQILTRRLDSLPPAYHDPGLVLVIPEGLMHFMGLGGLYSPFGRVIFLDDQAGFLSSVAVHEIAHKYQHLHMSWLLSLTLSRAHDADSEHFALISDYAKVEGADRSMLFGIFTRPIISGVEAFADTDMLWVEGADQLVGYEEFDQAPKVQFFVETVADTYTEFVDGHWVLRVYPTYTMQKLFPDRYPEGKVLYVPVPHPHLKYPEIVDIVQKALPAPPPVRSPGPEVKLATYLYGRPLESAGDFPVWDPFTKVALTRRRWASRWEGAWEAQRTILPGEEQSEFRHDIAWPLVRPEIREQFMGILTKDERTAPDIEFKFALRYFGLTRGPVYYETPDVERLRDFYADLFRQAGISGSLRPHFSDADVAADPLASRADYVRGSVRGPVYDAAASLTVFDRRYGAGRLWQNFDQFFRVSPTPLPSGQGSVSRAGLLLFDQNTLEGLGTGAELRYFALRQIAGFIPMKGGAPLTEAIADDETFQNFGLDGLGEALSRFPMGGSRPALDWFLGGLASVERYSTLAERQKAGDNLVSQDTSLSDADRDRARGLWIAGLSLGSRLGRIANVVQYIGYIGEGADPEELTYKPTSDDLKDNAENARFAEAKAAAARAARTFNWTTPARPPRASLDLPASMQLLHRSS